MQAFRSMLLVALVGVVACDDGSNDADRAAELEADIEDDEDQDDDLDLVAVPPAAPTRTDASGVDEDQPSLSLATEIEPDAMKRDYKCSGDPEGGTYNCCIPWGPYDVPYCCWWNGGSYECS